MFDSVTIEVTGKGDGEQIGVYDNGFLINVGGRPMDVNFASRVHATMINNGYVPREVKGLTTFAKAGNHVRE